MKRLFLLPLMALAAWGQTGSYLPLDTGNHWVYRATGRINAPLTVDVGEKQVVDGREYYQITGLVPNLSGETVIVRYNEDGKLVRHRNGEDLLLADFGAAEGSSYTSYMLTECPAQATIQSRSAHYDAPSGSFDSGIDIRYGQSNCRDAGLEQEIFLPNIGMVRRVNQTFAGPVTYDLAYARVGGVEIAPPQVSFRLNLDQAVYRLTDTFAPVTMQVRIDLRNSTATPLPLVFPSGQDFDLLIRDHDGKGVYRWSADKIFVAMVREIAFRGEKNWFVEVPLSGLQLAPGRYAVEATLATADEATHFLAAATFVVE